MILLDNMEIPTKPSPPLSLATAQEAMRPGDISRQGGFHIYAANQWTRAWDNHDAAVQIGLERYTLLHPAQVTLGDALTPMDDFASSDTDALSQHSPSIHA